MTALPPDFLTRPLAHRGYHNLARGIPENSRAAFAAAVEAGYGIELDVQLSADGRAMVFHDYHLGRLTAEQGPIRLRHSDDLAQIPLTGGSEAIPTLRQVLDLVAGRTPLLVEMKDQDGAMGPDVGVLERSVADALAGYRGPVAVMSYNPHSVAAFGQVCSDRPLGLTTEDFPAQDWPLLPEATRVRLRGIPDFERLGASFVSHDAADLQNPRVAELKASGVPILCWTIRSPEAEAKARNIADNITFEGYAAKIPTP